jgi:hypothetical protein
VAEESSSEKSTEELKRLAADAMQEALSLAERGREVLKRLVELNAKIAARDAEQVLAHHGLRPTDVPITAPPLRSPS